MSAAGRLARRDWLAANARDARVRCGITLTAIATALGVSAMTVWRWENGTRNPRGAAGEAYYRVIAGLMRHLAAGS
jgi:transcriptional regulator with XRE-family HTH domain